MVTLGCTFVGTLSLAAYAQGRNQPEAPLLKPSLSVKPLRAICTQLQALHTCSCLLNPQMASGMPLLWMLTL